MMGSDFDLSYYRYYQGVHGLDEVAENVFVRDSAIHGVKCPYCPATWYYTHKYVYSQNNSYNHNCLCRICGYTKLQAHEVDTNTEKCIYCKYAGPFSVVTSMQALEQLKQESAPTILVE